MAKKSLEHKTLGDGITNLDELQSIRSNESILSNQSIEADKDDENDFHSKVGMSTRIFILILICLINIGFSFTTDNPAALQDAIMLNLEVDSVQYNILYSLYSFPNIIFVFFGGLIVDHFVGLRTSGLIFTSLVFIGQLIFTIGGFRKLFWLMAIGRFIFGIGAESLGVVANTYGVIWFKGKLLNLSFGLQLCIIRLFGTLNMAFLSRFYNYLKTINPDISSSDALGYSFLLGTGICFISVLCSFILAYIDKKYRKVEKKYSFSLEKFKDAFDFKSIANLSPGFWLATMICVVFYSGFASFNPLAIGFFESKYFLSADNSSFYLSLYSLTGTIASPIIGFVTGFIGKDLDLLNLSMFTVITYHIIFSYTFLNPAVVMILIGISTVIANCIIWPLIAYVVPNEKIGMAYGIMQSVQNLGLALTPLTSGAVIDKSGFIHLEFYIVMLSAISFLFGSVILLVDKIYCGGIMNMRANKRSLILLKK